METTTGQASPRHSRRPRLLWSWSRDLLLALALSALFVVFLYQPVRVEGTSMLPGLQDQERIFINKFVYKLEPIERGDIVVFHYPFDPSKSYIKRVIGLSGDRVRIVEGQVYVNERPLKEMYVPGNYFDYRSLAEVTVPPTHAPTEASTARQRRGRGISDRGGKVHIGGNFDPEWFDLSLCDRDARRALTPNRPIRLKQPRPRRTPTTPASTQ